MTDSLILKSLFRLDNAFGVSGDEEEVAQILKDEMKGLYDEYIEDPLGNQFFIKYGRDRNKRVLISAHMDEIGFIINYIEENGLVRFLPVGYHDDRTAMSHDMVIKTESGRKVYGVTGSKPAHIMTDEDHEKVIKIDELYVDLGTNSREETLDLGVQVGDYMGFDRQGFLLNGGKYYTGKSVDNRSGCAAMVEIMRRIKDLDIEPTVCMVGSVMEEVGMRAGGPMINRFKPELMIALDVTLTGGTPGVEERQCSEIMGGGPGIKYYDWDPILGATGNNVPRRLTRKLVSTAEKYSIPFQREVMTGGGTDAWSASMAGEGVLAGGVCIPQRYMHTPVGTIHLDDLENTVNLMVKFLEDYESL
ncbi:MAG: M20/M25/M40 family metallo-hydrolase [Eubacteriales bacterium]|nr:M20/M25/M40 family metallo-hydrolase [Eubacteriales bacterium]MDD4582887.1 M20/M25/M40 family metallo-hydrolase [Eubacteriales bacterium]